MVLKEKPLKRKAYGSIGHLPNSRLGSGDHSVHEGQAKICTEKKRDKHDEIIVQEKLDGSCCSVAMVNREVVALGRAGWLAESSPFEQHKMFADWVKSNSMPFYFLLDEGERVVGEWLAQAHGTIYELGDKWNEPFGVFDIFTPENKRVCFDELTERIGDIFKTPLLLHRGDVISVQSAMNLHQETHWPCDQIEGVVYRVERKGKVDFLAKYVRHDKEDGKYLPEVSGKDAIWNWRP